MTTDTQPACNHAWTEWRWVFPFKAIPTGEFVRDCHKCQGYQFARDEIRAALLEDYQPIFEYVGDVRPGDLVKVEVRDTSLKNTFPNPPPVSERLAIVTVERFGKSIKWIPHAA